MSREKMRNEKNTRKKGVIKRNLTTTKYERTQNSRSNVIDKIKELLSYYN